MNKETKRFRHEFDMLQNDEMSYYQQLLIRKYQPDVQHWIDRLKTEDFYEKNSTSKWHQTDNQKRWNMIKNGHKTNQTTDDINYYNDNPIEYRWNNYGFRTDDDFNDSQVGVVTLGCSHTEGVGHHYENTWGYKLSKHFSQPHWNLGRGGKGLDCAYRLLYAFDDFLKYDKVFLLCPSPFRTELFTLDDAFLKEFYKHPLDFLKKQKAPSSIFKSEEMNKGFDVVQFGSNIRELLKHTSLINSLRGFVQNKGAEFYFVDLHLFPHHIEEDLVSEKECENYSARDGHWPIKKQHLVYKTFLQMYEGIHE